MPHFNKKNKFQRIIKALEKVRKLNNKKYPYKRKAHRNIKARNNPNFRKYRLKRSYSRKRNKSNKKIDNKKNKTKSSKGS
jgi:hypothetical protein